jgi:26S proteasome regulatory subunit N10
VSVSSTFARVLTLMLYLLDRHLVNVPPTSRLLSEALIDSPILSGDRAAGIPAELVPGNEGASGQGDNSQFEFGVDPSLDPELAMVRSALE